MQREENVKSAVPLLEGAVRTLEDTTMGMRQEKGRGAPRRHLYTAIDALSEAYCLLKQWDKALKTANEALVLYNGDIERIDSSNSRDVPDRHERCLA